MRVFVVNILRQATLAGRVAIERVVAVVDAVEVLLLAQLAALVALDVGLVVYDGDGR